MDEMIVSRSVAPTTAHSHVRAFLTKQGNAFKSRIQVLAAAAGRLHEAKQYAKLEHYGSSTSRIPGALLLLAKRSPNLHVNKCLVKQVTSLNELLIVATSLFTFYECEVYDSRDALRPGILRTTMKS